jgi:diphthine synthase
MLILIGLGMKFEDLTLEALDYIKGADVVYIDTYTNIYEDYNKLIDLVKSKEYKLASRSDLEGEGISRIVEEASRRNVAILVPGDPLIATTHEALRVEAARKGIKVVVVNGLSIASLAFSRTGLHFYKLGRTITLTYNRESAEYVVNTIYDNISRRLHTLVLLDIKVEESRAMSIPEAVGILLESDKRGLLGERVAVGIARLGFRDEFIVADLTRNLGNYAYPPPPHSIIIPGDLHFMEVESLRYNCRLPIGVYEKLANRRI